ncbi:hypothetical protein RDV89_06065 [Nocardioides zeae]|uniref:Lipoprotein LprG n=1 Tax=Nocardioides imazamoxiresistens TaxID=3231893 RepID=A0ABU3PTS2_9ACTN|nr:hypothetical protein [Nocardioides zeae]MDT9592621.1 hypothetical protein [Nocardioides zeae]
MRSLRPRRSLAAVSLGLLAALTLTACGEDSASEAGTGTRDDDRTVERAANGEEISVAELEEVLATAFDVESAAVEVTVDAGGMVVTQTGVVAFDPENPRMRLESEEAGEVLLVDGILYTSAGPGSGEFVAMDLDDPDNPFGATMSALTDPEASSAALTAAAVSVVALDPADIDGGGAEAYRIVLDTAAMFEAVDAPELQQLVDPDALPEETVQTIVLDDQGRVVRMVQEMPATDVTPEITTTTTYSEFGVEVDVEAPADAIPFDEFAAQSL